MAILVLTDAYVSVNAVVLSDHVRSVQIQSDSEMLESTAMGATFRTKVQGFKSWSMQMQFNQDFAANNVDATLWPLYNNGTVFAMEVRPSSANRSATNPGYQGNAVLQSYQPIAGASGELLGVSVTVQSSGALARNTT